MYGIQKKKVVCTYLYQLCKHTQAIRTSFKWGAFVMRYHPISKDLKVRIPVLRQQGYNVKKICHLLGIKKTIVYHTLTHFHCHGVPYNPLAHCSGHHRALLPEDLKLIITLLKWRHCIYLDELQAKVYNICVVTLSWLAIMHTLHHLHYSHKHVSTRKNHGLCNPHGSQVQVVLQQLWLKLG